MITQHRLPFDGLYMHYDDAMVGAGKHHFAALCARMKVGVWGVNPDHHARAKELRELGAFYVNTDFPTTFVE
jgi:glycerophosphoryl diester phosphodiesterase